MPRAIRLDVDFAILLRADVSVYGKLSEVGDGWIAIVAEKLEYQIPRESSLLIALSQ